MPFNPIPPFNRDTYPLTNVTPVTHSDGTTFALSLNMVWKRLTELVDELNKVQEGNFEVILEALNNAITIINAALEAQQTEFVELTTELRNEVTEAIETARQAMADQLAEQNAAVALQLSTQKAEVERILEDLQNQSIEFSDPVIKAIVRDTSTESRQMFDGLYSPRTIRIVLGIGQSNMSGRGLINRPTVTDPEVPDIYQYGHKDRTLRVASEPLDMIDTPAGIGPLLQTARRIKQTSRPGDIIVVVPCGDSGRALIGTSVNVWQWGILGGLSERAVAQTREALAAAAVQWPDSRVIVEAILWHQGEADAGAGVPWNEYYNAMQQLIAGFRSEFGSSVPFILGQLVTSGIALENSKRAINNAHTRIPHYLPRTGIAMGNAEQMGDNHHYDEKGQRLLAANYFREYARVVDGLAPETPLQVEDAGYYVRDQFTGSGDLTASVQNLGWEFRSHGNAPLNPALFRKASGGLEPVNTDSGPGTISYLILDGRNRQNPADPEARQTIRWSYGTLRNEYGVRIVFCWKDYYNYMAIELDGPPTGSTPGNYRMSRYIDGVRESVTGDLSVANADQCVLNVGMSTVRMFVEGRREVAFAGALEIPESLRNSGKAGYRYLANSIARMGPFSIEKYVARNA